MAPCGFPPGVFHSRNLCGISPSFEGLSPTTGQVTYALLSRLPLTRRSVRLACVRRAASVRPEPGSNPHQKDFRSNLSFIQEPRTSIRYSAVKVRSQDTKTRESTRFRERASRYRCLFGNLPTSKSKRREEACQSFLVDCPGPSRPPRPAFLGWLLKNFASLVLSHAPRGLSTEAAEEMQVLCHGWRLVGDTCQVSAAAAMWFRVATRCSP